MKYIALLRGINVGGKSKVAMSDLKQCFESLKLGNVRTYINSGNVLFTDQTSTTSELTTRLEKAIKAMTGLDIKVLVLPLDKLQEIVQLVPKGWKNDQAVKCDVFFVWPSLKTSDLRAALQANPEIEELVSNNTAIAWRIDRSHYSKSKVPKIIGSNNYKQVTIRNINTTRKLVELSES